MGFRIKQLTDEATRILGLKPVKIINFNQYQSDKN